MHTSVTEPGAGSDVRSLSTKAERRGDKWILNGSKMWITNAGVADWYFVVAYTDTEKGYKGMSAFIVEKDWPGVIVGAKEKNLGQRASDTRAITFENVEVPAENLVGQEGAGWLLAMSAFDHTRPAVSCAAVGVARAAMEYARDYSMERKTMGKPIYHHQAISFMVAEMAMNIDAGRFVVLESCFVKRSRSTKHNAGFHGQSVLCRHVYEGDDRCGAGLWWIRILTRISGREADA